MLRKLNRLRGNIYTTILIVIILVVIIHKELYNQEENIFVNVQGNDEDFQKIQILGSNNNINNANPIVQNNLHRLNTANLDHPILDPNPNLEPELLVHETNKKRITLETYVSPPPCINCPGENGTAVILTPEEQVIADKAYKKDFFNSVASEKASLWRSLPDFRLPDCRLVEYPSDLPTASVVIVFKNERSTALLRTVYSIIHRSPKHLLKEIILVDDDSDIEEVKKPLEDYCEEHFGEIVKIIRTPQRLGLIAGRNFGGKFVTADVIIFLDGHCEVTVGWIEPLLDRIRLNPKTVSVPLTGGISDKDLLLIPGTPYSYGIFTWSLFFIWGNMPKRVKNRTRLMDPYKVPTMCGGLFAVRKDFFFETGGYDDEMEVWGGENLEMSFRTWMCHGQIEYVPCSHVGHIFRPGHPYNMTGEHGHKDVHGFNSKRLAEAWMDDYKRLYYFYRKDLPNRDCGNVSSRLEIREKLKCHDFKWYLDNVIPEKLVFDQDVFGYGYVKNLNSTLCLDTLGKRDRGYFNISVNQCKERSSAQLFAYSLRRQLVREDSCGVVDYSNKEPLYRMGECNYSDQQIWIHSQNGQIMHQESGLCLDATNLKNTDEIRLSKCNSSIPGQFWKFENYINQSLKPLM